MFTKQKRSFTEHNIQKTTFLKKKKNQKHHNKRKFTKKTKVSKNLDIKIRNYFLKKYYFPTPCMIGCKIAKYCNSGIDISDGFISDLKKIVGTRFGAEIKLNFLPTSRFMKIILKKKRPYFSFWNECFLVCQYNHGRANC